MGLKEKQGRERRQAVRLEAAFGPVFGYEDDLITRQIRDFGAHARPELAMLLSVVAPGDQIFDIGAHIGTFTVPLAQKVGMGGKVIAVDGLRRHCKLLQRNLRLNGLLPRAEVVHALIAPAEVAYRPVQKPRNSGGTRFTQAEGKGKAISCTTLDQLSRDHFVPRIVKIDVEGFEGFALIGSELLQNRKPIVYAEISQKALARTGSSIAELDQYFRACGYRLFRNAGERNAADDCFQVVELVSLEDGGEFFDVLAVHRDDERKGWLMPQSAVLDAS